MKLTPQDIIDKEFRVKFRGFDRNEVDTFLEEVAETFVQLSEENTRLNEKILALQKDMESGSRIAPQGQIELPAELGNLLEELKQDTSAVGAEIVSLKQDRSTFVSLEKNIKEAVALLQKASAITPALGQTELPADLGSTLEEFRQGTETMAAELAGLRKEVGSIPQIREEIKGELKELLQSHFDDLGVKLSQGTPGPIPSEPKPKTAPSEAKKTPLPAAAIIKEEEPEDTRLPDFAAQNETFDDDDLEFLTEDDLLDVDKLRGIFQSALDGSTSNTPNNREDDDDLSADLLFLEDDIMDDEHEPEVTFSLDEGNADKKSNKVGKTR